jgi:hypothetical protein
MHNRAHLIIDPSHIIASLQLALDACISPASRTVLLLCHASLLFLLSPPYGHALPLGDDAVVADDGVDGAPAPADEDIAAAGDDGGPPRRMSCCVEKSRICGADDEGDTGEAPNGRLMPLPAPMPIILNCACCCWWCAAPPRPPCSSCAYCMRSGYGTTVCCW